MIATRRRWLAGTRTGSTVRPITAGLEVVPSPNDSRDPLVAVRVEELTLRFPVPDGPPASLTEGVTA